MLVEVDDEVSLAVEAAGELVGVHVAEGALLRGNCLWIDHREDILISVIIVWNY